MFGEVEELAGEADGRRLLGCSDLGHKKRATEPERTPGSAAKVERKRRREEEKIWVVEKSPK